MAGARMIILCDVDNVLSNDQWRVRFIARHRVGIRERYHEYHMAAALDSAHNLDLISDPRATVFLLTAMSEEYAHIREAWLRQYRIRYERVLYRPLLNHEPSVVLKRSMVQQLRDEGVSLRECVAAYDDLPHVVEMYREEGLPGKLVQINQQDHHPYGPHRD